MMNINQDYPTSLKTPPYFDSNGGGDGGLKGCLVPRFIPNFSSIMAPLTDCIKGKSFVWTEEAELAFQDVKEKLTTTPILILPDFFNVFELHTDASKVAIGRVLSQVVQAVKHWRHYLFHKEFVLFTDHDSLMHIRT
ncbi:putative reverse transcriptase domain-containing protein, partial [Tanacetum coccineum]